MDVKIWESRDNFWDLRNVKLNFEFLAKKYLEKKQI